MENNRQYLQMLAGARQKLSGRNPAEIARAAGFLWDGTVFASESLGIPFQLSWAALEITPALDM